MNKERLEEVKQTINHPNYTEHNGQEEIYYMVSDNDFNWLIEQAERMQELEGTVKHAMKAIDNTEAVRVKLINAEQQNKRYRQSIEVAIHNLKDSDNLEVKFALGILEQALESEENESHLPKRVEVSE